MHNKEDDKAALHVRVPKKLFNKVEDWRRQQPEIPSRPEAVRALIERALADRTAGEQAA